MIMGFLISLMGFFGSFAFFLWVTEEIKTAFIIAIIVLVVHAISVVVTERKSDY